MKASKFFQLLILCFIAIVISEELKAQPIADCNCSDHTSSTPYCLQYCALISAMNERDTADNFKPYPEYAAKAASSIYEIDKNISALKLELEMWEDLKNKFQNLTMGVLNKMVNDNFKMNSYDK